MTTPDQIPDDFKQAIFPNYVRLVTGNAIIGAQYVERVLNGICLILKADGLRFSVEDFMSGDATRTRQTLGTIERQLRNTRFFDPSFSNRLLEFTQRRNRVVHGLFADTFNDESDMSPDWRKAQDYCEECQWVAESAAELVETGFGIFRAVGDILLNAHPNEPGLRELICSFDEFYKLGADSMAHGIRQQLPSNKRVS